MKTFLGGYYYTLQLVRDADGEVDEAEGQIEPERLVVRVLQQPGQAGSRRILGKQDSQHFYERIYTSTQRVQVSRTSYLRLCAGRIRPFIVRIGSMIHQHEDALHVVRVGHADRYYAVRSRGRPCTTQYMNDRLSRHGDYGGYVYTEKK